MASTDLTGKKLSALPVQTGAGVANGDLFPTVDISVVDSLKSKTITFNELLLALAANGIAVTGLNLGQFALGGSIDTSVTDSGGEKFNVRSVAFAGGAKGDAQEVSDGVMTASSATLTSATAGFTSGSVGKTALVHGAGAAGARLTTTITAFVNSTTVTLAATASTSVTGATVRWGTNDSAAINAQILACHASGGGRNYYPKSSGAYLSTTQLPCYSNMVFEGDGVGASRLMLDVSDIGLGATGLSNVKVRNLTISGRAARMLVFASPTDCHIHDCDISGATIDNGVSYSAGIWISGATGITIEKNKLHGNGIGSGTLNRSADILVYPGASTGVVLFKNSCTSTLVHFNIATFDISYSKILFNHATGAFTASYADSNLGIHNSGYAILCYGLNTTCSFNVIEGNTSAGSQGTGIYLAACANCNVIANELNGNATVQDGVTLPAGSIALNECRNCKVASNGSTNSGRVGIKVTGGAGLSYGNIIEGNEIITPVGVGVWVGGSSDYTQVLGNNFYNTGDRAIFLNDGSGLVGVSVKSNKIYGTAGIAAGIEALVPMTAYEVCDSHIYNVGGRAIAIVGGGDDGLVNDNHIINPSLGNPGFYPAIVIGTTNTVGSDNKCTSTSSASNMTHGVYDTSAGTGNVLQDNTSTGHTVAAVGSDNPTVTKFFNNNLSLREISGTLTSALPLAGSTASFSGVVASFGLTNTAGFSTIKSISNTSTAGNVATIGAKCDTTPIAGFGGTINLTGEDSTTDNQTIGTITFSWDVVTHASSRGNVAISVKCADGSIDNAIVVRGGGASPEIGVLGATPQGRQSSPDLGAMAVNFGFASGTPTFGYANMTGSTAPLQSGFAFNFGSGNLTVTHSPGTLIVAGAADNTSFGMAGSTGSTIFQYDSGNLYHDLNTASFFIWRSGASSTYTTRMKLDGAGNLVVGGSAAAARLHVISTMLQGRYAYDGSNYYDVTIGSTGGITHDAVGSNAGHTVNDPLGVGIAHSQAAWIKPGGSTTGVAQLNLPSGVAPTSPIDGDVWIEANTATGMKRRINGVTCTFTFNGVSVVASGRSTAQTAANTSVATYTVGASDSSFEVSANVLVTTATLHSFAVTVDYTDEGNTARTLTLSFATLAGAITPTIANAGGAVPYEGVPTHIRCKTGTAITVKTAGTFTTVTYNVEAVIKQTI